MTSQTSKDIRQHLVAYREDAGLLNEPNRIKIETLTKANQPITIEYRCNIIRWMVKNDIDGGMNHLLSFGSGIKQKTRNHAELVTKKNERFQIFIYTNPEYGHEDRFLKNLKTYIEDIVNNTSNSDN
uniref:Uncharacterized protein n=1 Tax=Melicertus latisulcatus majanivirus TaxID=2984277 RepID=A0A9C7BQ76_9VIRU|nr:MAG: hypothetical protein [Melicertus latisulcatus majanivirus]